jgi:hypothetical protein
MLQNNIHELWALLHFLHPDKFPDAPEFEAEYNMADPEAVRGAGGWYKGRCRVPRPKAGPLVAC